MGAGYEEVHFKTIIFLFFCFFIVLIANFRSLKSDKPVEIIIGFFVLETFSINGISVISGDAILYAGQFNFSSNLRLLLSNTDAKTIILFFLQNLKISEYHLNGVYAVLYKLYKVLYLDHVLSDFI